MASQALPLIRQSYNAGTTDDYVERLCSSWLLPPSVLFGLRTLVSLYAFVVLFFQIGWRIEHGQSEQVDQSFSYFTVLGYWGLAFYFSFAAAHTASYAFRGRAWLQSWPSLMRWAHMVFYASVTVFPFIVTAVYWGVLSDVAFVSQYSTWSNISQHALNSCFAFLEILISRSKPHPWINLPMLIVLLAMYLGLAYLTHDTEGIYVYDFLDPTNGDGSVAGYCFAILAATVVVFIIVRYLQKFRNWITESKLGLERSSQARGRRQSDILATEMGQVKSSEVNPVRNS